MYRALQISLQKGKKHPLLEYLIQRSQILCSCPNIWRIAWLFIYLTASASICMFHHHVDKLSCFPHHQFGKSNTFTHFRVHHTYLQPRVFLLMCRFQESWVPFGLVYCLMKETELQGMAQGESPPYSSGRND